jgi:hypothetical protein
MGASRNGTEIRRVAGGSNPNGGMIRIGVQNDVNADVFWRLTDVTLNGDRGTDAAQKKGLELTSGSTPPAQRWGPYNESGYINVERVTLVRWNGTAFEFGVNLPESRINDVLIQHCNGYGLDVLGRDSDFTNVTVGNCAKSRNNNIRIKGAGNKFTQCRSWWAGRDLDTTTWAATEYRAAHGWEIDGSGGAPDTQLLTLSNCLGQDCSDTGFFLHGANNVQIVGADASGNKLKAVHMDACTDIAIDFQIKPSGGGYSQVATGLDLITTTNLRARMNYGAGLISTTVVSGADTSHTIEINRSNGYETVAYAATVTPNLVNGGRKLIGPLTGNISVNTPTNPWKGARMTLMFQQDATGGRTITLPATIKATWTPSLTASKYDVLDLLYDGTNWIQTGATVGVG